MARYTGPKCRLCRREGMKLFLKGARCESEKCAIAKRRQAPGQHGNKRARPGSFEIQLREKQRAKRLYGVLEKQFSNYVKRALKEKEVTGEVLMRTLELRLDSTIYRAGFAASRPQAREFVRRGYFAVDGNVVTIPSYQLTEGSEVSVTQPERIQAKEMVNIPSWMGVDAKDKKIAITKNPKMEEITKVESTVNPQLIIEYYSR